MYFVAKGKEKTGPFTPEQLKGMVASGQLGPGDLVWTEGMAEWQAAGSTLQDLFGGEAGGEPGTVTPQVMPPAQPGFQRQLPRNNPMALTGMILGIVSLFTAFCCFGGIPLNIAGIIFSIIGLNQINADPERESGRAMALVGLWCSIASVILGIAVFTLGMGMNWNMESVVPSLPVDLD